MERIFINDKGFSLLEVLIALVILALGLLALGNMQVMGIGGNSSGQKITTATTLAQDAMEKLMNLDYAALPVVDTVGANFDTDFTVYNGGVGAASKTYMGVDYVRTYSIDRDFPVADVATIQVTVTWLDQAGNPHSVTETSAKRNGG